MQLHPCVDHTVCWSHGHDNRQDILSVIGHPGKCLHDPMLLHKMMLAMQELATGAPAYVHRFTTELVKVMRRISEDHSTQKGLLLAPIRPAGRNPK